MEERLLDALNTLLQEVPVDQIPIHQIHGWAKIQRDFLEEGFKRVAAPRPIGIHVEEQDVAILSSTTPSTVDSPDLLSDLHFMQRDQSAERVDQWRTVESRHTQNQYERPPTLGGIFVCSTPLDAIHIVRKCYYEQGISVYHTGGLMFGNRLLEEDISHLSSRLGGSLFYIDAQSWWLLDMLKTPLLTPQGLYPYLNLLIEHANVEVQLVSDRAMSKERKPPSIEVNQILPSGKRKILTLRPSFADLLDTCKLITSREVSYLLSHNRQGTPLDSTHVDRLARRLIVDELYKSAVIVLARPWLPVERVRQELLSTMQAWYVDGGSKVYHQ